MAVKAPLVVTERLELWQPQAGDRAHILAIVSAEQTGRYLGLGVAQPAEQFQRFSRNAGSWFLYGYGNFTVRSRKTGEVIGNCGIFHSFRGLGADFDDKPEAGWIVRHDQVGQGLASEAMIGAIGWFERTHGPQPIMCMISPGNAPSENLARKLAFQPLREAVLPDGETVTLLSRPAGGVA